MEERFHQILLRKVDAFVHDAYDLTEHFPRSEVFGATSQLKRAALSVLLNYTEGYARFSKNEILRFLRIAYGSLKETLCLIGFAYRRKWVDAIDYRRVYEKGDEIGRMLWSILARE